MNYYPSKTYKGFQQKCNMLSLWNGKGTHCQTWRQKFNPQDSHEWEKKTNLTSVHTQMQWEFPLIASGIWHLVLVWCHCLGGLGGITFGESMSMKMSAENLKTLAILSCYLWAMYWACISWCELTLLSVLATSCLWSTTMDSTFKNCKHPNIPFVYKFPWLWCFHHRDRKTTNYICVQTMN